MKAAGMRGSFGLLYSAVLLLIFDGITCKYNGVVCRYGVIEDWDRQRYGRHFWQHRPTPITNRRNSRKHGKRVTFPSRY